MEKIESVIQKILPVHVESMEVVKHKYNGLAKPIGSLGRLEELGIKIAGIQRTENPRIKNKVITLFAGDHHTVFEENIASAPMEITARQLENFSRDGGAINVFANNCGARLVITDVGVATEYKNNGKIINKNIGPGANNITKGPAMSYQNAIKAIETGIEIVENEVKNGLDILGLGEMGIGNTTPSSCIFSLYTGAPVEQLTGPGAGISPETQKAKIEVIKKALRINNPDKSNPVDVLAKVGGYEIGALTGAIIGAASHGVPVMVDGFISTAALFLARALCPLIDDYIILSHSSAETGHSLASDFMRKKPLLDLGLRLGEGTGAAIGISLVEYAIKALDQMEELKNLL
jgi:nicotinate-nucleotide--dimethylbenzimidazole phosphoribosyltransferase